jgi:hypothetical protein
VHNTEPSQESPCYVRDSEDTAICNVFDEGFVISDMYSMSSGSWGVRPFNARPLMDRDLTFLSDAEESQMMVIGAVQVAL